MSPYRLLRRSESRLIHLLAFRGEEIVIVPLADAFAEYAGLVFRRHSAIGLQFGCREACLELDNAIVDGEEIVVVEDTADLLLLQLATRKGEDAIQWELAVALTQQHIDMQKDASAVDAHALLKLAHTRLPQ